jgi:histone deacetylase complex regulatory component SIN3
MHPDRGRKPPAAQAAAAGEHVEFDRAMAYLNKVNNRFEHDQSVYHSFLELLQTYQRERRSVEDVCKQVARLFEGHPDLFDDFALFAPSSAPQAELLRNVHQEHILRQAEQTAGSMASAPSSSRAAAGGAGKGDGKGAGAI